MAEPDIACDLDVFSVDESSRHRELMARLKAAVTTMAQEGDSLRIGLATPAAVADAVEFALLERKCCPFFGFAFELPVDDESAGIVVSGPKEALTMLSEVFREA